MRKYLVLAFLLPLFSYAQTVTIPAGPYERQDVPVYISLKKPADNHFGLVHPTNGNVYALQWQGDSAVFIPSDPIPANQSIQFQLKQLRKLPAGVSFRKNNESVAVQKGKKNMFAYQIAELMPPTDSPNLYKRSGFIHPLYTPDGLTVTDAFPSNHAHQHAVFHAWTHTRFKGHHVDFWNQHKLEGTVGEAKLISTKTGAVYSEMVTKQNYISLKDGVILSEVWVFRIYNTKNNNLFDLTIRQENITKDTLFLDQYIYGGMAFRGSAQWDPHNKKEFRQKWQVLTSEGIRDTSANNTAAKWVSVSGLINQKPASVTVIGHPSNYRYPQKIRVHPDMPYWVFSPVIDKGFFIPPSGTYSAGYRYLITNQDPSSALINALIDAW
jgi:hypothetical protein